MEGIRRSFAILKASAEKMQGDRNYLSRLASYDNGRAWGFSLKNHAQRYNVTKASYLWY
jgi:hypothetical protein